MLRLLKRILKYISSGKWLGKHYPCDATFHYPDSDCCLELECHEVYYHYPGNDVP